MSPSASGEADVVRQPGPAARSNSLARRLVLALLAMLVPLLAVAGTGVFTFRGSLEALGELRREAVDESRAIEKLRGQLVQADDLGEAFVEEGDPSLGERYEALRTQIERSFTRLRTLNSGPERDIVTAALELWNDAQVALAVAAEGPQALQNDNLDPFHDSLDEAAGLTAELNAANVADIATVIPALRRREQTQLFLALTVLLASSIAAFALAGRLRRSIIRPLGELERATVRFADDDLSHRVPTDGVDELARVGEAFNAMAERLQRSTNERNQARGDLERVNSDLEERVAARTRDLEESNRNLFEAKEAAEAASHAKSEFLSRMSHELRTPLNAILGFGQLLQGSSLSEDDAESVNKVVKAGRHLLRRINELLDIAGVDSGRLSLSIEPVVVEDVIREAIEAVRPEAARSGVEITHQQDGEAYRVMADRERLRQGLAKLIANGVAYNHQGGAVSVSWKRVRPERLSISVADTGSGIPLDRQPYVFSAFDSASPLPESRGTGIGLGLALTRALVEAMGGTVALESEVGRGSSFTIELPDADARQESFHRPTTPPAESLGPEGSVLHVDDNAANLDLVDRVLSHRPGVRLLSAQRASDGLELAQQQQPDLILLDLHLPRTSGDEVLRQLRAEPRTERIPVVIMSADATAEQIDRLKEAGAADYLTKPLDVNRLLELIDQFMKRAKGGQPGEELGASSASTEGVR